MKTTILVADDEEDALNLVSTNLKNAGFAVVKATDGASALEKARAQLPKLIVLDLMLPGMSGTEVCKALKSDPTTARILIIMLTARADEMDRVLGLELGADDYITKPFSPRELVLRVKAVLRRHEEPVNRDLQLTLGEISVDRTLHEVRVRNNPVELTATEFKLLTVLIERQGRLQSRDRLLSDVWGYESSIETRTVDTHVRRLREKLGPAGDCIETIRGFGYRIAM